MPGQSAPKLVDDPLRRAQILYLVLLPFAVLMVRRLAVAGRSVEAGSR
ncbi:hypothetical protein [Cellulomonas sp. P5_C5]